MPLHVSIPWQENRGVGATAVVGLMDGLGCGGLPGEQEGASLDPAVKIHFPPKTLVCDFPAASCPMLL